MSGPSPSLQLVSRHLRAAESGFAQLLLLILAATGCDLITPWMIGAILDVAARPHRELVEGLLAAAALVALQAAAQACRWGGQRILNRQIPHGMIRIGSAVLARILRLEGERAGCTTVGASQRIVSAAMEAFNSFTNAAFVTLGPSLLVLVGLFTTITWRWPLAGLISGCLGGGFVALNLVLTRRWIAPASAHVQTIQTNVHAALADVLGARTVIQDFDRADYEDHRFAAQLEGWREVATPVWNRFAALSGLQNLLLIALQASLLAVLIGAWARGRATAGDVGAGLSAFLVIVGHLRALPETLRTIQRSLEDLTPAAALLTRPLSSGSPDAASRGLAPTMLLAFPVNIRFEAVRFTHLGANTPLFAGLDLHVSAGERLAVVGPTGAGKSTLVGLITGRHTPDAGRILIDGVDIAKCGKAQLRRLIAVAPQEPILFNRSLAENVAYARPDASRRDILKALEDAQALDLLDRLENGLDTPLGERGARLSGGERQRLALARAFLKDAPLLLLDEPSSSLDPITEAAVLKAIAALACGRTSLMITHRLSTVTMADRVIVLEQGRIVQIGSHDTLRTEPGLYADLVRLSSAPATSSPRVFLKGTHSAPTLTESATYEAEDSLSDGATLMMI